jgi:hypothetical protein
MAINYDEATMKKLHDEMLKKGQTLEAFSDVVHEQNLGLLQSMMQEEIAKAVGIPTGILMGVDPASSSPSPGTIYVDLAGGQFTRRFHRLNADLDWVQVAFDKWRGRSPRPPNKRKPTLRQLEFVYERCIHSDELERHGLIPLGELPSVCWSQRTKPFRCNGFYFVPSRWVMSVLRSRYPHPLLSDLEICAAAVFPETLPKDLGPVDFQALNEGHG